MTYFSGAGSGDTFAGAATGSCCSDGGRVPGRSPRRVRTSNLEGMRERSLILAIRREFEVSQRDVGSYLGSCLVTYFELRFTCSATNLLAHHGNEQRFVSTTIKSNVSSYDPWSKLAYFLNHQEYLAISSRQHGNLRHLAFLTSFGAI
jgi:hypothetical protein